MDTPLAKVRIVARRSVSIGTPWCPCRERPGGSRRSELGPPRWIPAPRRTRASADAWRYGQYRRRRGAVVFLERALSGQFAHACDLRRGDAPQSVASTDRMACPKGSTERDDLDSR